MKSFELFLGLAFLQTVAGDWQFKSRPDLAPPRLNITIPATKDVEKGYLFLTPFAGLPDRAHEQHGPRQEAPYIFTDEGELVWSGYTYFSIWSVNFQAAKWKGKDVLFAFEGDHNPNYGHGHGHATVLDQHYETIRELRAGNHRLSDKHEFHIVNEETALIQIYQPTPANLSAYGAKPGQQWIVDAIFQELDISTGEVLFEWSSFEHISPDESVLPINLGQAGSGYNSSDAWDYFHINSVEKDFNGSYLISARDASSIHKINGTTSEIIWRLGGTRSDFKPGKDVKFGFQHHARFLKQYDDIEIISLFDNSAHGTENGGGSINDTAPTSSGKILKLNTTSWEATLIQAFYPPDGLLAKSQGSNQILPNGNAFINWGSEGAVTEFSPDGTPIFHAYLESGPLAEGVQGYRSFRFNWTGLPNEDPATIALENDGHTTVYVSWNGDTETKIWRFYTVTDGYGSRRFLGEAKRTGFETSLKVKGQGGNGYVAEAVDGSGNVLRTSGVASVKQEIKQFKGSKARKMTGDRWVANEVLKVQRMDL